MAGDPYSGTRNEKWHRSIGHYHAAQLAAAGFQWPDDGAMKNAGAEEVYDWSRRYRSNSRYVGGVTSAYDVRLQKGDHLFRFSDSKRQGNARITGAWWFSHEVCLWLSTHSPANWRAFRDNARQAFCVLEEYGDMGNLVEVQLTADLWAILGSSAPAAGKSPAIHNPYGLNICQLYIPGAAKVNLETMTVLGSRRIPA